ncbi:MAG: hypothetical protein WDM80_10945 [Limisphaerales bacterium]
MNKLVVTAAGQVTEADLSTTRLGSRFGRLDLMSQLALLAVEKLGVNFDSLPRERIAICLAAKAGSLSTDVEFWKGRNALGGPSPTLFAYTLPSAAIGEIAIRHRLTGPNLCFVGNSQDVLPEAADLLWRGEADACVCLYCQVISADGGKLIQSLPVSNVCALFLQRDGVGQVLPEEFDSDMESLCAKFRA